MTSTAPLERDLIRALRAVTRATRLADGISAASSRADMLRAASALAESLDGLTIQRAAVAGRLTAARRHGGSGQAYARAASLGTTT
ncbi:hypothetical protein [Roseospira visakhapatnamensis]|uniref:Uncharacterized protein n=1 Tax=Roseospira visakhapatnamensis TaxID=390880 RepID=A0A7W6W8X9_9PROT|nr:hypothetical protein [Roseospira visakhapatnamensis]MBB4265505.1 hypothetical protein [Roseospira visakhapatnamensis]